MGKPCICCGKKPEECRNKHHRFDSDKYDPSIIRFVKTTPSVATEERTVVLNWSLDENGNRTGVRVTESDTGYQFKERIFGDPVFTRDEEKIIVNDRKSLSDADKNQQEFIVSQTSARTGLIERETTVYHRVFNESHVESRLALVFEVADMADSWVEDDFQGEFKFIAQKLAIMMSDNVDGFVNEDDPNPKIKLHGLYFNEEIPTTWRKINQMIDRSAHEKSIEFQSECNRLFKGDESAWVDLEKFLIPELAEEDPPSREDIGIAGKVLRGDGRYMFLFEPEEGSTELGAKPCRFTFYETKTHKYVDRSVMPYIFLEFVRRRGQCKEDGKFIEEDPPPFGIEDYTNESLKDILAFPGYNWHDDFSRAIEGDDAIYTSKLGFLTEEYKLSFDNFYRQDFFWRFDNTFSYKVYRPKIDNTRRGRRRTFLEFSQRVPVAALRFPNEVTTLGGDTAEWSLGDTNYDYEMYQKERVPPWSIAEGRSLEEIVRKNNMPPKPFVYNMSIQINDNNFTARQIPVKHYHNALQDNLFGIQFDDRSIINNYHPYPYVRGGLNSVLERTLDYNQLYGIQILYDQVDADRENLSRQRDRLEETLEINKDNPDYEDFTHWTKGWISYPEEKTNIDGYFGKYCFKEKIDQLIAGYSVKNNKLAVELSDEAGFDAGLRATYFAADAIEGGHPGFYLDQVMDNYDQYIVDPEEVLGQHIFEFTIAHKFYAPILRFTDCIDICGNPRLTDHVPPVKIEINAPFDTDDCYRVYSECDSKLVTVSTPSRVKKLEYNVEGTESVYHYTDEFHSFSGPIYAKNETIQETSNLVCPEDEQPPPLLPGESPPPFVTSIDVTWDFNNAKECIGDQELPVWEAKLKNTLDESKPTFPDGCDPLNDPDSVQDPKCQKAFLCLSLLLVGRFCFSEDQLYNPCPKTCSGEVIAGAGSDCIPEVGDNNFDLEEEREKLKEQLEPNGGIVGDCTGVRYNTKRDRNFPAYYWDEEFDVNSDIKSIPISAGTETEFSPFANAPLGIKTATVWIAAWSDFTLENIKTGETPYTTKENLDTLKVYYADGQIFGFKGGVFNSDAVISYSLDWPSDWWRYTETPYWDESVDGFEDEIAQNKDELLNDRLSFDGQLREITREKKFTEEQISNIQPNLFDDAYIIYLVTDEEPVEDDQGNIIEQNGYWKVTVDNHEGPFELLPFPIFELPSVYKIQTDITYFGAVPSKLEHKKRDSLWEPQSETQIQDFLVNLCDSRQVLSGIDLVNPCPTYGYAAVKHHDFDLLDSQATEDYVLGFALYDQYKDKGCISYAQCEGRSQILDNACAFTRGVFNDNSYHCDNAESQLQATEPFSTITPEFEWSDYKVPEGYLEIREDESPEKIEIQRKEFNINIKVCEDRPSSIERDYKFTIDVIAYGENPRNRFGYYPEFNLYDECDVPTNESFHKTYSQKRPFFNSVLNQNFSCFSSLVWLKYVYPDELNKRTLRHTLGGESAAVRNIRPGVTGNHKDDFLQENNLHKTIEAQLEDKVYLPNFEQLNGINVLEEAFPKLKDVRDREIFNIDQVKEYYGSEIFYTRKLLFLGSVSEQSEDHTQEYASLNLDTSIEKWNQYNYIPEFAGADFDINGDEFPTGFDFKRAFNGLMITTATRDRNKISAIRGTSSVPINLPEFLDKDFNRSIGDGRDPFNPDFGSVSEYPYQYEWPYSWTWDQASKQDDPDTQSRNEAEECLSKSCPATLKDGIQKIPTTLDYGAFWYKEDLRSRGHVSERFTEIDNTYSDHLWTVAAAYVSPGQKNDPNHDCTRGFHIGAYCDFSGYMGNSLTRINPNGYTHDYIEAKVRPIVESNLRGILEAGEGAKIKDVPVVPDPPFPNIQYGQVENTVIEVDKISIKLSIR